MAVSCACLRCALTRTWSSVSCKFFWSLTDGVQSLVCSCITSVTHNLRRFHQHEIARACSRFHGVRKLHFRPSTPRLTIVVDSCAFSGTEGCNEMHPTKVDKLGRTQIHGCGLRCCKAGALRFYLVLHTCIWQALAICLPTAAYSPSGCCPWSRKALCISVTA